MDTNTTRMDVAGEDSPSSTVSDGGFQEKEVLNGPECDRELTDETQSKARKTGEKETARADSDCVTGEESV